MPSGKNQTTDFQPLREAYRFANHYVTTDMARLQKLREILIENIKVHFPERIVCAQSARRLPGTISIAFPGIPGDVLIANCPDYCFSRGLSCSAGPVGPSHVLKQI
jgi:cysteine sulfinate desulfinase/cysteine desulfurase-like protein